jgi:hypothetical protein
VLQSKKTRFSAPGGAKKRVACSGLKREAFLVTKNKLQHKHYGLSSARSGGGTSGAMR